MPYRGNGRKTLFLRISKYRDPLPIRAFRVCDDDLSGELDVRCWPAFACQRSAERIGHGCPSTDVDHCLASDAVAHGARYRVKVCLYLPLLLK
jgi:hypothetical protein